MSNGEYGDNVAELESRKMERQQAFAADLENLRTLNYSDNELMSKKQTLSDLEKAV